MKPFIIDFHWLGYAIRVPSYGAMMVLGYLLGYFETLRRAIREKEDPRSIEDLFLIVIASVTLGSRLFHVVFEDPVYYFQHPAKIFAVWEGGYTFYGGLLLGMLGIYFYCRIRGVNFLRLIDIITPAAIFGSVLGRVGCFLAGCCWGKPTAMPWGVVFHDPLAMVPDHVHALHPTQLYEAAGLLVLSIYLWFLCNRRKFDGQVFFSALIGYAVIRFVIEFWRGDDYRGFILGGALSYAQMVSLTLLPFTIVAMFLYSRLRKSANSL
ncbi:MAG: prolipoprotein diacylglyceryl transferase [Deltaproteobacteria bacterium]|nr:prolipoprotein diacylglyceryl transferase [Deltaproteobacteria bacterium]MBI3295239.1 prolipoprotein diacylglyceryl transferase [Deltaproteobacteria bacterium]